MGRRDLGDRPERARSKPSVLRAPNGVLQDSRTYWGARQAQYDPGDIKVPALIIHAEWDADLPSDRCATAISRS